MDTPQWPWQQNPSGEPELPACWTDGRRHDHLEVVDHAPAEVLFNYYRIAPAFLESHDLCSECGMWVPKGV